MKVIFKSSLIKDAKKMPSTLRSELDSIILQIENANSIKEIPNLKKLKGYSIAYRVKIGAYRLCLFYDDGIIILARFLPRKDIYRFFP